MPNFELHIYSHRHPIWWKNDKHYLSEVNVLVQLQTWRLNFVPVNEIMLIATRYDTNMIGTGCDLNNRINSQIIICLFDARFYLHYALLFTLLFRLYYQWQSRYVYGPNYFKWQVFSVEFIVKLHRFCRF